MILHLLERLLLIIFVIVIGSRPVYNENFAIVTGKIEMPEAGSGNLTGVAQVDYPEGFNKDNCSVISIMGHSARENQSNNWYTPAALDAAGSIIGTAGMYVSCGAEYISVRSEKLADSASRSDVSFKVILMKLPNGNQAGRLGDVNLDGEITEADKILMPDFIVNGGALTFDQYANADCDPNRDGKINSGDTLQITKYLEGQIDHL